MVLSVYLAILLLNIVLAFTGIVLVFKARHQPGGLNLIWFLTAIAIWSFSLVFETTTPVISQKISWSKIEYLGVTSSPVFLLLFVLAFSRKNRWLIPPLPWLYWIIPLISLLLAWTNEYHALIWTDFVPVPGSTMIIYYHGAWFWVMTAYIYLLLTSAGIVLVKFALSMPAQYRKQAVMMLLAGILPLITNLLYVLLGNTLAGWDFTPLGFVIMGLLLTVNFLHLNLFNLIPPAADAVMVKKLQQVNTMLTREITEREQIEQRLQTSEDRFRQTVISISDHIYVTNIASSGVRTNLYISPHVEALTGFPQTNFIQDWSFWRTLIHPDDQPAADAHAQQFAAGIDGEIEYRLIHANGQIIWVRDSARVVQQESGIMVYGLISNITERKAMQAEQQELLKIEREHRQQLRSLTIRLSQLEDQERRNLSRELHDQVGQNLSALGINLNIIKNILPQNARQIVDGHLEDSMNLVEEIAHRVRDVMAYLRPPVLDDYGLLATLNWYGRQFSIRTNIITLVDGVEPLSRLDMAVETALFRITQEALTNVSKHANATHVDILLEPTPTHLRLTITDNGDGFAPAVLAIKPDEHNSWGLLNMEERAQAIGGTCRIHSMPGEGVTIIVEVPL